MLGNALCESLHRIKQNSNTAHVEEDNLYCLTQCDCDGWKLLVSTKPRNMANTPNVYEQNRELIHSYFHPDTLTSELINILGGPRVILDPMFYMPTQQDPHAGRTTC